MIQKQATDGSKWAENHLRKLGVIPAIKPTAAQRRALQWLLRHGGHIKPAGYDRFVSTSDGSIMPSTAGLVARLAASGFVAKSILPYSALGVTMEGIEAAK